MLLQILVNALALGASYALLALGFVLILNATGAVNFAHGDMVMAGGYASIALGSVVQLPGALLLPMVVAVMAAAVLVLFTSFLYDGGVNGFSPIWICLLPPTGMFFFGIRKGTALSAAMLAVVAAALIYAVTFVLHEGEGVAGRWA